MEPRPKITNTLQKLNCDIFNFLTGTDNNPKGLLVKKHSENLPTTGDISFPNTVQSWHMYINKNGKDDTNTTLLSFLKKNSDDIIASSKTWILEVIKVIDKEDRVYMFLNRAISVNIGLSEAVNNILVINERLKNVILKNKICFDHDNKENLTALRLKYTSDVIRSLLSIYSLEVSCSHNIVLTYRSSYKCEDAFVVLCGAVLNAKTGGKETNIKADDYIRIRQDDMSLIAQHKYGIRVSTDSKWREFVDHLGESAVAFELLQGKPSAAVKVNFECCTASSSKGVSFVLYNCARLETIIRTYSDKVGEGIYPALPPMEEVDFSLLTQEDEWSLVYNYIMWLPSLLSSCLEVDGMSLEVRPHHLCSFLSSMVRVFSQYYRKIRILTEPRKHLLPVLFARLHMLRILNDTLKTCLNILNIKSVSQMYFVVSLLHYKHFTPLPTPSGTAGVMLCMLHSIYASTSASQA